MSAPISALPDGTGKPPRESPWGNVTVVALVAAILIIYIGSLIVHNYIALTSLRRATLENLVRESEKRAAAVSYFFAERRNDLRNLLARREIGAFFENQALGMSMEYGLGLSLHGVSDCLRDFTAERVVGTERIYARLVFLDREGRVLADTAASGGPAAETAATDWTKDLAPEHPAPRLLVRSDANGQVQVLVSSAYFFKNRYAGQALAFLRPEAVTARLVRDTEATDRFGFLTLDSGAVYGADATVEPILASAGDALCHLTSAQPFSFTARLADGLPRPLVAVRVPVEGSILHLVRVVGVQDFYGRVEPWEFPVAMGILAVVILTGAALALRSRLQAVALGARLTEASAQRRWLEDKNRQLEREVAERRLLSTAIEQAAEAIMITRTDGTIQYVNPAFERITGYTAGEVIGRNPRLLKSGRQDAAFYSQMWETLQRGDVWSGHFTNRRKDGVLYEEEAVISPVREETGALANYVAVKHDVTAQMAMKTQLHQSQKMEAIGELAGGISHDFNNLLTVILGNCNLLLHGAQPLDKSARDTVEEILNAGNRATSLTRQLLTFSRRAQIKPEYMDLNAAVANTQKLLRRLIRENVAFSLDLPATPTPIEADPVQVDQILINLVVNACDAMPAGGRLAVRVRQEEVTEAPAGSRLTPRRYAVIEVADTGTGMSANTQAHIFEPFFTTKAPGAGTGLGLATIFAIAQQHHGDVRFESELGKGTTFRVFLPLSDPSQASLGASLPEGEKHPVRGGTETVLLVEDEESMVTMIQHVLRNRGYRVLSALTDREVLDLWKRHRNDITLLLADVVMPGMSGIEIGNRLRAERPGLKVLCMSAYTDSVVAEFGFHKDEMEFLQKPFTPSGLLRKVREVIDRTDVPPPPPTRGDGPSSDQSPPSGEANATAKR